MFHVEQFSYSKTKNLSLTNDEVTTVAAKIVKVLSAFYDVSAVSDSEIKVVVNLTVQIDTDSINEDIFLLKQENEKLKESAVKREDELSILHEIRDLQESLIKKYTQNKTYRLPMKLTMESTWQDCLDSYFIDMSYQDYSYAEASLVMASGTYWQMKGKSSAYDDQNCSFELMFVDCYLLQNNYRMAARFAWLAKRNIDENPSVISDDNKERAEKYYPLLYRYMMKYHPEWQEFVFKK